MLPWDEVRRLIVLEVGPSLTALGFGPPGRTQWRRRGPFLDVIDFRCDKYGQRARVALGCGLRQSVKPAAKPWDCIFNLQHFGGRLEDALEFQDSIEQQVASLRSFTPRLVAEIERWFGLLPDLTTARRALERNDPNGPEAVALFEVSSPAYVEAIRLLRACEESS